MGPSWHIDSAPFLNVAANPQGPCAMETTPSIPLPASLLASMTSPKTKPSIYYPLARGKTHVKADDNCHVKADTVLLLN